MSTHTIQIVVDAQDRASKPIQALENHLLKLSKNARMLHRETYGLNKFANALDTIAGTHLSSLIGDLTTVGEVADPLAKGLGNSIKSAFAKVASSSVVVAAQSKLGSALGDGIGDKLKVLGAVGIGVGIGLAFEEAAKSADEQVKAMSADEAKLYSGTFADTLFTSMDQFLTANGLKEILGPSFAATLDDLAAMSAKGGTASATAFVKGFDDEHLTGAIATSIDTDHSTIPDAMAHQAFLAAQAFDAKEIWDKSAQGVMGDLAGALMNTSSIDDAMNKVEYAITHPMAIIAQEAQIAGDLARIKYQSGLAGTTAEQKTIFDQQTTALEAIWKNLTGKAWDAGAAAGSAYRNAYIAAANKGTSASPGTHHRDNPPGGPGWSPPLGPGNGGRASGGPVYPGGTYTVGERGPETLHMGRAGGYVTPNSGGQPIHVVSAEELARILDRQNGRRLALAPASAYTRG